MRQILIVEGDADLSQRAATHFRNAGWAPLIARDAMHALTSAKDSRPDVIVLNSALPGSGMQALTRLKSNIKTAAIPIVIVTELSKVYENAGAQKCTPNMADFTAVEQAAIGCFSNAVEVQQPAEAALHDAERLAALQESRMLDSPTEPILDAITRLAARLTNGKTALISLVDKDRQFFKSQVGLKAPWSTERQSKLSHSFCQWVVTGKEPLVIEDARSHPILKNNLAIRDLGVISYMGVPLETSGQPIGSLCAINSEPRQWSAQDLQTLHKFAAVVETFSLPLKADRALKLDKVVKALAAIQSISVEQNNNLEQPESELLWQIVARLGHQLTSIT